MSRSSQQPNQTPCPSSNPTSKLQSAQTPSPSSSTISQTGISNMIQRLHNLPIQQSEDSCDYYKEEDEKNPRTRKKKEYPKIKQNSEVELGKRNEDFVTKIDPFHQNQQLQQQLPHCSLKNKTGKNKSKHKIEYTSEQYQNPSQQSSSSITYYQQQENIRKTRKRYQQQYKQHQRLRKQFQQFANPNNNNNNNQQTAAVNNTEQLNRTEKGNSCYHYQQKQQQQQQQKQQQQNDQVRKNKGVERDDNIIDNDKANTNSPTSSHNILKHNHDNQQHKQLMIKGFNSNNVKQAAKITLNNNIVTQINKNDDDKNKTPIQQNQYLQKQQLPSNQNKMLSHPQIALANKVAELPKNNELNETNRKLRKQLLSTTKNQHQQQLHSRSNSTNVDNNALTKNFSNAKSNNQKLHAQGSSSTSPNIYPPPGSHMSAFGSAQQNEQQYLNVELDHNLELESYSQSTVLQQQSFSSQLEASSKLLMLQQQQQLQDEAQNQNNPFAFDPDEFGLDLNGQTPSAINPNPNTSQPSFTDQLSEMQGDFMQIQSLLSDYKQQLRQTQQKWQLYKQQKDTQVQQLQQQIIELVVEKQNFSDKLQKQQNKVGQLSRENERLYQQNDQMAKQIQMLKDQLQYMFCQSQENNNYYGGQEEKIRDHIYQGDFTDNRNYDRNDDEWSGSGTDSQMTGFKRNSSGRLSLLSNHPLNHPHPYHHSNLINSNISTTTNSTSFDQSISKQLEQMIRKLAKELQQERKLNSKLNLQIKRLGKEIIQVQNRVKKKNDKIYELEMSMIVLEKQTNDRIKKLQKQKLLIRGKGIHGCAQGHRHKQQRLQAKQEQGQKKVFLQRKKSYEGQSKDKVSEVRKSAAVYIGTTGPTRNLKCSQSLMSDQHQFSIPSGSSLNRLHSSSSSPNFHSIYQKQISSQNQNFTTPNKARSSLLRSTLTTNPNPSINLTKFLSGQIRITTQQKFMLIALIMQIYSRKLQSSNYCNLIAEEFQVYNFNNQDLKLIIVKDISVGVTHQSQKNIDKDGENLVNINQRTDDGQFKKENKDDTNKETDEQSLLWNLAFIVESMLQQIKAVDQEKDSQVDLRLNEVIEEVLIKSTQEKVNYFNKLAMSLQSKYCSQNSPVAQKMMC